jgi:hypothetical protein
MYILTLHVVMATEREEEEKYIVSCVGLRSILRLHWVADFLLPGCANTSSLTHLGLDRWHIRLVVFYHILVNSRARRV